VLASRGARLAQGQVLGGARTWITDIVVGLLISAPVYWMFTKFLAISLPGLTQGGWL
jgi:putative tricarboxylic transport membrane protein